MASPPAGKADHVIFIWLGGGMSQIDTFDPKGGRGHQSSTFSLVLAGGGLKHRGAIGLTDEWSKHVTERPVSIPDFHATIHHALGIDFQAELYDGNRPVPITDGGKPIAELFV